MKAITPQVGMTIEFTYEELRDLYTICGYISGSKTTARGTATNLYRLLEERGVVKSQPNPVQSMKFPTDADLGV